MVCKVYIVFLSNFIKISKSVGIYIKQMNLLSHFNWIYSDVADQVRHKKTAILA